MFRNSEEKPLLSSMQGRVVL